MNTIVQTIVAFDTTVNTVMYSLFSYISHPLLTKIMKSIAFICDPHVFGFLSIPLIAYFAYKKQWNTALLWFFSIATTIAAVYFLKIIIHRPRPEAVLTDFSFPSGHCAVSLVFFCLLYYTFKEKLQKTQRALAISAITLITLLIGFNRLYVHAHWLSDVIGGYSIGILVFILCVFSTRKYLQSL
jgi:undecaprenyl-diphosphatase